MFGLFRRRRRAATYRVSAVPAPDGDRVLEAVAYLLAHSRPLSFDVAPVGDSDREIRLVVRIGPEGGPQG